MDAIIEWRPDIVLAGGPPLYLGRIGDADRDRARRNAERLAGRIGTVILDHHLMRSRDGAAWLDALSASASGRLCCAADFMGLPRRLLEADRVRLYEEAPVPDRWHDDYAAGRVDPDPYLERGGPDESG